MKIFDPIRSKWVVLTPEEWVRQHIVQLLIQRQGFPAGLVGVEKRLMIKGSRRRCDIVLYGKSRAPLLLVECKAPDRKISALTFSQISSYNMALRAPYLLVTNGLDHRCCQIDLIKGSMIALDHIPTYKEAQNTSSWSPNAQLKVGS